MRAQQLVDGIRKQRQQAQAAAAQQAQAAQQAKSARDLAASPTDSSQPNALTDLMQQSQAGNLTQ
jgi:hypothetical protein